jgi:YesN/AraC family two-component response regulator
MGLSPENFATLARVIRVGFKGFLIGPANQDTVNAIMNQIRAEATEAQAQEFEVARSLARGWKDKFDNQARRIADLEGDKANLIATQANELALIGMARDGEKAEAADRIAELEAFVANVAERHHSSDHYSLASAFERFQTRARALLPADTKEGEG